MISSVLVVAMAAYMQPTDTTRASREAFTGCLRAYVDRVSQARMPAAEFATAYPQQCTAQQTAYHDAIVRRERASRASQADAEESATTEIEDSRTNFREVFEMNVPPTAQAAATPAPTGAPAATPAATPASAPAATPAATPAAQTTPPH